ncbi:MAG: hypothetical protein RL607_1499 [Bacteroidota bacterium]|jgi:superfamily II DNA or RNA helicase/HKD family nuclease
MDLNQILFESLKTGFVDRGVHSVNEYLPQLLLNDKIQGRKVLSSLLRELNDLKENDEFWFSVAFVTSSGVAVLKNALIELQRKNIKGKILVSQYLNFTQPEALRQLMQFKNIELRIVTHGNFHSKGYLFKKGSIYNLIVGSSNLTANALCANKEWNLKISATPISQIIHDTIQEFTRDFSEATVVDLEFLKYYEPIYLKGKERQKHFEEANVDSVQIVPNSMQEEALGNLKRLRASGKKRALLISATGTGKTFLSAFDVQEVNPKKFLFIVHRENIAKAAMRTFKKIFGTTKKMGMFTGNNKDEADFLFATVQTISKQSYLDTFDSEYFDYIVIDETHRAGAETYQRILNHFEPNFLLGMTATPERGDNFDIFKSFDYNIAYEIRLNRALDEDMLSPFHYYGVTDITVNGSVLDENADFKFLTAEERINHIIEKSKIYGCDSGIIRGLVFCSSVEECKQLAYAFNARGLKSIALTGNDSEERRNEAISLLESKDPTKKIDYIFTRDIFNEGIDIPSINQVIMLRPTQSAIVFVQQLGRGLRKAEDKEYLTVIDFIGNYSNSFLIPIALYGDSSYNKDTLRKLMSGGSNLIPGASTINFEEITKKQIFDAIDSANMQMKKDLESDFIVLKNKLGHYPMMMDFIEHGSRDPFLYVKYAKSYFNFVKLIEKDFNHNLTEKEIKLLECFANDINNAKRIEEVIILDLLLQKGSTSVIDIQKYISNLYDYKPTLETIESAIRNLNFDFITENKDKKLQPVSKIYEIKNVVLKDTYISCSSEFKMILNNTAFYTFLKDNIEFAKHTFNQNFNKKNFIQGFILYQKYSRKDVFRILNWETNPLAQNVGGYIISSDKSNCPIFVNYHKSDDISGTTKYEDGFINKFEFQWMSKSKRNLKSPDVITIRENNIRLPLFIKKSNDEGTDFYYMGDVQPIDSSFKNDTLKDDNGNDVNVVTLIFKMNVPVEDNLYNYLTESNT